jgi:glucose uptake protein
VTFLTRVQHALYGNNDLMTIPGSYFLSLILLILGLVCWGSWGNTLKLTGPKWRFELFAYDFAIGVLLAASLAALTFGSLSLDGFTIWDDLRLAGKHQDVYALMGGALFSLANMMLLGAITVTGMAVAFPVCLGTALVTGVAISYAGHAAESPLLAIAGAAAMTAAVVFAAVAWKKHTAIQTAAAQAAASALSAEQSIAPAKTPAKTKSKKSSRRKASAAKGLGLGIVGGLLMGAYIPFLDLAKEGENGLGPYTAVLIFAVGAAFSTFVCNLFFMNLPIQGPPLEFSQYLTGTPKEHGLGILGGMIWCTGTVAFLVAGRAEGAALVSPTVTYGIESAAVVIAAIWGLVAWKEFGDAEGTIRLLLGAMLLLLVAGIGVVSMAPVYIVH